MSEAGRVASDVASDVASGSPAFTDLFSAQAATYAAIRPDYPPALVDFIVAHAARRTLAWDCATGNGQAALALAERFDRVIATDTSAEQLAHARPHERIEYRVAAAEASGLPEGSVDLVTVAQALHWFDRDRFYREARRVLVPGGLLAVWSYGDPIIDDAPVVDDALRHFNLVTVGSYWPPGRGLVGEGYRRIPFPFAEITVPSFRMERVWTMAELLQYLRSWSARQRYLAQHGTDPVTPFADLLAPLWGDAGTRHHVVWPLSVRCGRCAPAADRESRGTENRK